MKVMKILNKYMKPFLKENGFEYKGKRGGDEPCYIHKDNDNARIFFSFVTGIEPCSITTEVYGGIYDNPNIDLSLSDLLNGPDEAGYSITNSRWYFDTEEELIGILECQAELLKSWVFDWMLGKKYTEIDIYKRKDLLFTRQAELYDNASKEEKDKIVNDGMKMFNKWEAKRFYPVNWKL